MPFSSVPFSGTVPRPAGWTAWVNERQTEAEVAALRRCAARGTPFGHDTWVKLTAAQLGLTFTLRSRGRPRKSRSLADSVPEAPTLFDQPSE